MCSNTKPGPIHARKLSDTHGNEARVLLSRVAFVKLSPPVLARALEAFPEPLRTSTHSNRTSMDFLRGHGSGIEIPEITLSLLNIYILRTIAPRQSPSASPNGDFERRF